MERDKGEVKIKMSRGRRPPVSVHASLRIYTGANTSAAWVTALQGYQTYQRNPVHFLLLPATLKLHTTTPLPKRLTVSALSNTVRPVLIIIIITAVYI